MGVIYILTNPSFPEYVKIGYATDIQQRLRQLNRSECLPYAFRVYATYEVPTELSDKQVHMIIDSLNPNLRAIDYFDGKPRVREFYAMPPESALALLKAIAAIHGCEDKIHIWCNDVADRAASEQMVCMNKKPKRPSFKFSMVGLKPGDIIAFRQNGSKYDDVEVEIFDDRRVFYESQLYTLSALARIFLDFRWDTVQGTKYFAYQGELLDDMRTRMEKEQYG